MSGAYINCTNIRGLPASGDNVTNMYMAYYNCQNLTGSPICDINVKNMANAYSNCQNLYGPTVIGPAVQNIYGAFYNCINLTGNVYIISNNVTDAGKCFDFKNNNDHKDIDVYVKKAIMFFFIVL